MSSDELAETDVQADVEPQLEVNPVFHVLAPIAAIAVTMVVRKAISAGYQKTTGHPFPEARDPRVPFVRAVLWTAVITTTVAVAEVAVYRAVNRYGARRA
jgi:hypothetical protein